MKKAILPVLILLACASVARAESDELEPTSSSEFYFGFLIPYNTFGGDLNDGHDIFVNSDGAAVVPDVKGGVGGGLVLGFKLNGTSGKALAAEISAQGSRHDADFMGSSGDANLGLLSADVKLFPTTRGNIQPWVQAGFCAAGLDIENGFTTPSGGKKDVTFAGSGFNLGAGVLMYASERIAFHFAGIYRFIRYDSVDYGSRADLNEDLNGNMLSLELGATFRFNRR